MNRIMSGSVLSLLLVAGFAQSARSELYIGNGTVQFGHHGGHHPDRHSGYRTRFEHRNRGFGGQIYIQGDERTVIRERTTVFGGGDRPTVILREAEAVRPGRFGGEVYYDRDGDYRGGDYRGGDYRDGDYRNDGRDRYDPFYRRTVERSPINQDPFPVIQPQTPIYQAPIYQPHPYPQIQRTYFRTCTTTIEGVRTCN
jgi:hypothetical protein